MSENDDSFALVHSEFVAVIDALCEGGHPWYRDMTRRLHKSGLLKKKDIQKQDLLFGCDPKLIKIFVDWDPGAQIVMGILGKYPHHWTI